MLSDHPTAGDLQEFLTKPRNCLCSEAVVRHLLADCPVCRDQLARLGWSKQRVARLLSLTKPEDHSLPSPAARYNYDRAFNKAEATLSAFISEGRPVDEPPPEILAELLPISLGGPITALSRENQAQVPHLVRWLVQRSHAKRFESPAKMLELAHLARLAVDACTPAAAGGAQRLSDLQAQAWREFGNALRICGRLRESEEALAKALNCLEAGTKDPSLRALWLQQMSSLRLHERQFANTLELLEEARQIYQEIGEKNLVASTLVQTAVTMLYRGTPADAIGILELVISKIDPEDDPLLLVAARHNLVRCYIDLGKPQEALSLYYQFREANKDLADPLILLRISWQEGQLLRELGHLYKAEEALLKVRRGLMEKGLAYEVALVSFDLASVYAKQGRAQEVRELVSGTIPIFRALRIGQETIAALIQLAKTPPAPE